MLINHIMKFNSLRYIFILAALLLTVYFFIPFREGHTIPTAGFCAVATKMSDCGVKGCKWIGWEDTVPWGMCVTHAVYNAAVAEAKKLTKKDCAVPAYQWVGGECTLTPCC